MAASRHSSRLGCGAFHEAGAPSGTPPLPGLLLLLAPAARAQDEGKPSAGVVTGVRWVAVAPVRGGGGDNLSVDGNHDSETRDGDNAPCEVAVAGAAPTLEEFLCWDDSRDSRVLG